MISKSRSLLNKHCKTDYLKTRVLQTTNNQHQFTSAYYQDENYSYQCWTIQPSFSATWHNSKSLTPDVETGLINDYMNKLIKVLNSDHKLSQKFRFKGNREQGTGNRAGVGRGFKPRPTQSPQGGGASDPLVGRGNEQATISASHQKSSLLPVARSLFPRPKVGDLNYLHGLSSWNVQNLAAGCLSQSQQGFSQQLIDFINLSYQRYKNNFDNTEVVLQRFFNYIGEILLTGRRLSRNECYKVATWLTFINAN